MKDDDYYCYFHFFGQISLGLIQVCYFLIEWTRIGDGLCLCLCYVGNNWTLGRLP